VKSVEITPTIKLLKNFHAVGKKSALPVIKQTNTIVLVIKKIN
jgi:hypothetical protein